MTESSKKIKYNRVPSSGFRKKNKKPSRKKNKQSLSERCGDFLYKVGFFAEMEATLFYNSAKVFFIDVMQLLNRWAEAGSVFLGNIVVKMGKDIITPLTEFNDGYQRMKEKAKENKKAKKKSSTIGFYIKYLREGIVKHGHLTENAVMWGVPLIACALTVFWVNIHLKANYALAVQYNGDIIAYVENDGVYEGAVNQVQTRLVYNTGNNTYSASEEEQEEWTVDATLQIRRADVDELISEDELVDTILKNSGEEIVEATGLYVNGVFYGATTEVDKLLADIAAVKAPYEQPDNDAITVEFVDDVQIVDGIFFVDNLRDYDSEMHQLFTHEVEGERYYEVEEGASPSYIAAQNNITLAELYAMNPELEGGGLWVGDRLVVSRSRMMLRVKVVERIEVEETVPRTNIVTYSDEMLNNEMQVVTQGNNGLNLVTYEITYIDGVEDHRERIHVEEIIAMVPQERVVGTRLPTAAGSGIGTGSMVLPLPAGSFRRSRGFYVGHTGTDLAVPTGTPVYATDNGYVSRAVVSYVGYGVYVIIDHGNGVSTLYAHNSQLYVSTGQYVTRGQVIAASGSTGNSTGPHLHFEVRINNTPVNPAPYIGY
jgi:Membrane proteins related to metalloendopeptidases